MNFGPHSLYGRRRVGKTYLVEQMFSEKFAFNVTGVIDGTKKDEMSVFWRHPKILVRCV